MLDLYGMLEFKLYCETLLLRNMSDMGCLYVVNETEYLVYSMHMNRQSACKEFMVCIVGKLAQDVGMV